MNLTDLSYEEEAGFPRPRKIEVKKESKAGSKRAELIERTLQFLGPYKGKPRNPKVFAMRVSFLSVDDLEYMLSTSKAWVKNPQACWWTIFNKSKPK